MLKHWYLKLGTIIRFAWQRMGFEIFWRFTRNREEFNRFEYRLYSQNGEDGLIHYLFRRVGEVSRFFVEIGAGDGKQCNTRYLKWKGWVGVQFDAIEAPGIKKHFVTVKNVEKLLKKYKVPTEFDLLSIDVDGNDYWIWKAIENYKPRVVIIEYNASIDPRKCLTIPYQDDFVWDGSMFAGASLGALAKLGEKKGYRLVGTNRSGVNAFFVRRDLAEGVFEAKQVTKLYHKPQYNQKVEGEYIGHRRSDRMDEMVEV